MIEVTQNDDKTFTISWDENDPQESMFNDWTEKDFLNAITNYINTLEKLGVVDNATQAINEINNHIEEEFFIDQTPEEVEQDIINAQKFLRDQDTELKEDRVVPPPNFPLFP